jgi:exodeoxyribonuclease VII small subunit
MFLLHCSGIGLGSSELLVACSGLPSELQKHVNRRMAKRKSPSDSTSEPDVTLEAAMTELSQIVSRLESGQETLDESLSQFERGMTLLRICHRKLDSAAQRIELVTQLSPNGDVATEEFDATSTLQRSASADTARAAGKLPKADNSDDDDSGLLF